MTKTDYNRYPKAERIEKELTAEIQAGRHGEPGSPFMTTRDLTVYKEISLKTAHQILGKLCEAGLLEVRGKRYYRPIREKAVIGLLLTRLDTPYFSTLAANIEEIASQAGYEVMIATSNYDDAQENDILTKFERRPVAGILACPWGIETNEARYQVLTVPYVLIGRKLKSVPADAVMVDNQMASRQVAEHLLETDCREFAYLGPANLERDQRLAGFRGGLMESGILLPDSHILQLDDINRQLDRVRQLLRNRRERMGIFCYHDLLATRVIQLCHEEKIAVPETVAIVGFDNLPVAAEVYPTLTSVSYPLRNMAVIASEILMSKINRQAMGHGITRYLESQLVIRQSTCLTAPRCNKSVIDQTL